MKLNFISRISVVFSLLRNANLKLQFWKSPFVRKFVNYLCHVIFSDGRATDPQKIKKMKLLWAASDLCESSAQTAVSPVPKHNFPPAETTSNQNPKILVLAVFRLLKLPMVCTGRNHFKPELEDAGFGWFSRMGLPVVQPVAWGVVGVVNEPPSFPHATSSSQSL